MTAIMLPCFAVALSAKGDEKKSRDSERENITHIKGANHASESYAAGKYYSQLTSIPYTGDNVTDLIAVALSQLGYMESNSVDDMSGTTGGKDNYTEFNYNMGDFGVGYGTGNYDWCASFVSFCLLQSRCTTQNRLSDWCRNHMGDSNYIWREVGCPKWAENLDRTGYYRKSAAKGGDYLPNTGDLIFFRWSPEKAIGHIGIVLYNDGERVYTIEGNTSGGTTMVANGGAVHFKNYALDYSCIDGYGQMPYERNEEVELIDYSGNAPGVGTYVSTIEKKLYFEPSVEGLYATLPAYSFFEVIDVYEDGIGGMLKAVCEIDGNIVGGYIVNDSAERVIQVSREMPVYQPVSFLPYYDTDGFVGGEISAHKLNGEAFSADEAVVVTNGDVLSVEGFFGFESEIVRLGYYIDGDREAIEWINGGILEPSEQMEQIAGEYALKCEIAVNIERMTYGGYNLTYVIELENGVITVIDSLEFKVKSKPDNNDSQNSTEAPTDKAEPTDTPVYLPSETQSDISDTSSEEGSDSENAGCNSSAATGAIALAAAASAVAVVKKRRKNN